MDDDLNTLDTLTYDNGCEMTFVEYSQQNYETSYDTFEGMDPIEFLIRYFPMNYESDTGHLTSFKQRSTLIKDEIVKIKNVNDRLKSLNMYREFLFDYHYTLLKESIDKDAQGN